MLKVFLHSCAFPDLSDNNVIGRLDIAYEELAVYADYKASMVLAGVGQLPLAFVRDYPRWSASIWDLVTRVICVCLHGKEQLPFLSHQRSGAFMEHLTAGIEHWPDGFATKRSAIGYAEIKMTRRRRSYDMKFEDDIMGVVEGKSLVHTPDGLNAWDLLARCYAWAKHGSQDLPPRPRLAMPPHIEVNGRTLIPVKFIAEPARTGLERWMYDKCMIPISVPDHEGLFVKGDDFSRFLNRAV